MFLPCKVLKKLLHRDCLIDYWKELAYCRILCFNSLPNNKFLNWSKLKAFADNKLNLAEKMKFVLGRVENLVGKG